MIELLCLISNFNDEKSIKPLYDKYNLPYNFAIYGKGTASSSLLEYFGLEEIRKYIYLSLINTLDKKNILNDLETNLKLNEPGKGICFTIPLSSSTKHILNKINNKEENMEKDENKTMEKSKDKKNYHLIVTIITEGYSDKVMNTAKKAGASGGTLIRGRSLFQTSSKRQFLGFSIEPEKDVVLIVANDKIKKPVMEAIVKETGLKTKAGAIVFALPISEAIGLYEEE